MTPPRNPFTYAVIRVVPDVEREEFLNAGLILLCRPQRFLAARTALDVDALEALHPGCDAGGIGEQLALMERIASGSVPTAPFADMSQPERFHWLTTPRSTLVQPGPVHGGTTDAAAATFDHLFDLLVTRRGNGAGADGSG